MSAIPKIDLQKIRVEDVYPFIRDLSVKLPFLIVLFSKVCINGTMYTTSILPVKSGVPLGSILGPLLFILFINDIYENISSGTNISLYADDTKIWRQMNSYNDCIILQNDISSLNRWCIINKMRFHPDNCKVSSVSYKKVPWIDILPSAKFSYELQNSILDYVDNERDSGF